MFYVLSKLIGIVITNPIFYCIILLLVALKVKRKWIKTVCVTTSFAILLICSNRTLYDVTLKKWATPYIDAWDKNKVYQYGIVLGGFAGYDKGLNRIEFEEAADRFIDGVLLYKKGHIKKLVIASDGSITSYKDKGNPEVMLNDLRFLGVPSEDVIFERKALNTRQNAIFTIPLLGEKIQSDECLLITSAAHMRRSLASFKEAGLTPDAYIVDISVDPVRSWEDWIPDLTLFSKWQALIHEWIGFVIYKIMGY